MLVFESSSVEEILYTGWNGQYNGKPMSAGKYLWIINAVSTEGKTLLFNDSNKGVVTLLK